ncbi:hypothetical protein R3P38DRAFT_2893042 [Favolaschia claudopus]|uniref:Secreted protein n=1 Tax=Favolaschia claudopus TaxID=2862362 RepID=A0AAW0CQX7_9AGAR
MHLSLSALRKLLLLMSFWATTGSLYAKRARGMGPSFLRRIHMRPSLMPLLVSISCFLSYAICPDPFSGASEIGACLRCVSGVRRQNVGPPRCARSFLTTSPPLRCSIVRVEELYRRQCLQPRMGSLLCRTNWRRCLQPLAGSLLCRSNLNRLLRRSNMNCPLCGSKLRNL